MSRCLAVSAVASSVAVGAGAPADQGADVCGTHWAAEQIKRQYVEEAIADFEKKNPGIKIKASWYEKNALYAALNDALRAGQVPDIISRRTGSVGVLREQVPLFRPVEPELGGKIRTLGQAGLEP